MNEIKVEFEKIKKFSVVLHRLKPEHLELVRLWRNDPEVNQWLGTRTEITAEQQIKWYSKLDPEINFYYIIEFNSKYIGLVNLKNYDPTLATAEGGIFLGDKDMQNGSVAIESLIAMYDFGFRELKLTQITALILPNNARATRLNQAIGFQKVEHHSPRGDGTELWNLAPEDYELQTKKYRAYLS